MASDSLLKVIAGLVKREGRIAREDAKKAKEALKAEAEKDEEDEDEDPVGEPPSEEEPEKEAEPKKEPEDEEEPKDDGEGDTKPTGPDPTLVAQVAAIVKKEIEDETKEKKETEVKLSGKKEKIDTKPKMEQGVGRMNFKEAIRMSVTGTTLTEGYESHVLQILDDEEILGPLGYEPFFEKGKLFVMKGQERNAQKALKNSGEINRLPKIVGEELETDEYLAMEAVDVDGRCKGFKEALRRLTYEKIKQIKEKEKAKKVKVQEHCGECEFGLEEKAKYDLYHKTFSDAMQHAYEVAKKQGFVVDPKEIDDKVATGPKKPSSGKTNRYILGTDKKKNLHVQVANLDNKRYELNMYIEGFEIVDESLELQAIMALDDAGIEADISKKGEVVVKKKDLKKAEKALKKSFAKGGMPKLVVEEVEEGADKDTKGDKEAYQKFFKATLKKFGVDEPDQLTGDKKKEFFDAIDKGWKADNEKPEPGDKKEEVEIDEDALPEGVKKEDAASFMAAASAAKRDGKKTFKFGDPEKEYPVTIKVDIPAKKEEVEIDEALKPADKKVLDAFYNQEKASGKLLDTDGKSLDKMGMGGQQIAVWKGNKIKITAVSDVKSTEEILRALKKSIPSGLFEEVEIDEKKMSMDAKRKQAAFRRTPKGKKSMKKAAKKAAKFFKQTGRTARDPQAAAKKARKAKTQSYVPGGSMIEKWKSAAFDKIRAIRSRLGEGLDATAARELKLYIVNDRDLYKRQIVPIIKNVQRKMKSGKYDHRQAPKLWMYLVDNGAKQYVKEFGGDVKTMFPKDLRLSIANEFANEYKAEIEIQGGEMV